MRACIPSCLRASAAAGPIICSSLAGIDLHMREIVPPGAQILSYLGSHAGLEPDVPLRIAGPIWGGSTFASTPALAPYPSFPR
jgi:hypothetical protein